MGFLSSALEPGKGSDYPDNLGFEWSRQALGKLNWTVGQDLLMTPRYAGGRLDQLPDLVAELVRLEVSVIVADGPEAARAVIDAATTTPTVVVVGSDLTRAQLFGGATRPSTVTGVASETQDLVRRRLSLLKEAMPSVAQVSVLWNGGSWAAAEAFGAIDAAAQNLGLQLRPYDVRTGQDIEGIVSTTSGSEVFLVVHDPLTVMSRNRIAFFAEQRRIPMMMERRSGMYALGLLLEVGPSVQDMYVQAAAQVDQIVRGARPADLPMEPPAKLDIVVNQKAAKNLGLTIPQAVLAQATFVIQ
ncbi:MAG: ABC transporter substrate-binding protein [Chloroflexota bacterium]